MKKIFFSIMNLLFLFSLYSIDLTQEQKKYCVSITALLSSVNGEKLDTLETRERTPERIEIEKNTLKDWWSIWDREDLIKQIEWTYYDGHSPLFYGIVRKFPDYKGISLSELRQQIVDTRTYNYTKFVYYNYDLIANTSFKAWDLVRSIHLCRWGYTVGYLTEEEAWERILKIAKTLQIEYKSFEEIGNDYLLGRCLWAAGFGEELEYYRRTFTALEDLLKPGTGYWTKINWNTNLNNVK
jgi:hypothetical protein